MNQFFFTLLSLFLVGSIGWEPTSVCCGQVTQANTQEHHATPERYQLFDGKTLKGWQLTSFGGEGECRIEDGVLILEPGFPLTGVTSELKDLPTTNYELVVEAQRAEGNDFFCGLTFPVADSHCCLIVGGWAGATVGLSNIDDLDASRNETKRLMKFENEQWYCIRVRVTDSKIEAWIDDQQVVDLETAGRKISLRNETLPTRPMGICAFQSLAKIRKIELKK